MKTCHDICPPVNISIFHEENFSFINFNLKEQIKTTKTLSHALLQAERDQCQFDTSYFG